MNNVLLYQGVKSFCVNSGIYFGGLLSVDFFKGKFMLCKFLMATDYLLLGSRRTQIKNSVKF